MIPVTGVGTGWGGFFEDITKSTIKTAIDYNVADAAIDRGLSVPESNMFTALPSQYPQGGASQSPSGLPFRFVKADGKLNYGVIAVAGFGALLLLKAVK